MKTMLCLYINSEIKELAKSKGINLSKTFEEFLNINIELTKEKNMTIEEENAWLKQQLALTMEKFNKANEKIKKLELKSKENEGKTIWKSN